MQIDKKTLILNSLRARMSTYIGRKNTDIKILEKITEQILQKKDTQTEDINNTINRCTDAYLTIRISSGDKKSLEILREKYLPLCHSLIDYNHYQKEDIIQEVWIKVYKYSNTYDYQKNAFSTWLGTIIKNTCRDEIRTDKAKDTYHPEKDEEEQEEITDSIFQTTQTPEKIIEKAEEFRQFITNVFQTKFGYPWQLIIIGYIILGYKPSNIAQETQGNTLCQMYEKMAEEYCSYLYIEKETTKQYFQDIEKSLEKILKEIITDKKTKEQLKEYLEKITGEVQMKNFYGEKPSKNISDWHIRTMIRIKKEITK